MKLNRPIFFALVALLLTNLMITPSCKKVVPEDGLKMDINEFIWEGLNYFYLWYTDSYNLSDSRFNSTEELKAFLRPYNDSEELFYDLLYNYGSVDRYSWIVDDYVALEKYFQGITTSMGFKYTLFNHSGDYLTGVIMYVVKGSPADNAGLKRGDLFAKVDGSLITETNYPDLLYDKNTFTLTMAEIVNNVVNPLSLNISISKEEVHENPVYMSEIYNIGDKKVGYIFYKGFRSNYEEDLNTAFGIFQNEGIDELVLDLRYNGGGTVSTCAKLGSMIYEADPTKIFCRKNYNDKYGPYRLENYGPDANHYNFYDKIQLENNSTIDINSLGLDHLYILATGSSASASELLINCLRAYMEVTIIGSKTYGKNVGSITVKDWDENGDVNPDHTWAMQPIVSMSYDVNNVSEYGTGFEPDYPISEDLTNLLPFGDVNELMLKTAFDIILGQIPKGEPDHIYDYNVIMDSDDHDPFNYHMIFDDVSPVKN